MSASQVTPSDRTVAGYGVLATWTLLLLVLIRHLLGVPTTVGSLAFPTPITVPILLLLLPLLFVELLLIGAAVVYSVREGPRSARGVSLLLATAAVFYSLANKIGGFHGRLVLPGGWLETVFWVWGLSLILLTGWWFRRPRNRRVPLQGDR